MDQLLLQTENSIERFRFLFDVTLFWFVFTTHSVNKWDLNKYKKNIVKIF